MLRLVAAMLLPLILLSACNATPSPGPRSEYEKTFSGDADDGSRD